MGATKRHFGDAHPVYASSLSNLAYVHKERGELELAESTYHKSLALYEALCGDKHPSTMAVIANLGVLYTRMAQGAKGLEKLANVEQCVSCDDLT